MTSSGRFSDQGNLIQLHYILIHLNLTIIHCWALIFYILHPITTLAANLSKSSHFYLLFTKQFLLNLQSPKDWTGQETVTTWILNSFKTSIVKYPIQKGNHFTTWFR